MTAAPSAEDTRTRVARLISDATEGQIGPDEILDADVTLLELGVGSLAILRLADALEEEFGIELDLGGPSFRTESLDTLTARILGPDAGRTP
ncbi:phosphopantetheine-binding protein [Streptomyces sp. NPDC047973]|uniref:acyl carrier protein n=1 Tax=unclassified Streptomyces TaxID=2593676 RepID=UPI00342BF2E0